MIPQSVQASVVSALAILPLAMDSAEARVMLYSIGLQESRFLYRYQLSPAAPGGKGPARGFWQFERGTAASRGGVWGMVFHPSTSAHLRALCGSRDVDFDAAAIHAAIETDDVLAAGLARLGLWADPKPLPKLNDPDGAWDLYARTWRPGKPKRDTWTPFHREAVALVDRRAF